uniref:Uncharacterized protein n=1 Tax=Rhizophora mucronata TaxID=61149 RepID=A0A2P2NWG4_RHIMU
MSNFYFMFL